MGGIAPAPSPTIRVLNAGSGTTGTTEFFALLCRYGVPSVHYSFHCNLGDNRESVLPPSLPPIMALPHPRKGRCALVPPRCQAPCGPSHRRPHAVHMLCPCTPLTVPPPPPTAPYVPRGA